MNRGVEAKQDKMLCNLLNSSAAPYKDQTSDTQKVHLHVLIDGIYTGRKKAMTIH